MKNNVKIKMKNKAKNTLVSGNAGDEKNLHLRGQKKYFFNRFSGDVTFSSLICFAFFYSFFCLFVSFFVLFIF